MPKLLLCCSKLPSFAALIGLGLIEIVPSWAQTDAPVPAFNAASIKQHKGNPAADFRWPTFSPGGRFTSTAPLDMVIAAAWHIPYHSRARLSGAPTWVFSDDGVYDIEATAGEGVSPAQMRLMLQKLLADRFHLIVHPEKREIPIYAITVAKGGPKLERADIEEKDCQTPIGVNLPSKAGDTNIDCHSIQGGRGRGLHARAADMSDLARSVEGVVDRPVIDQTGIKGLYRLETSGWLPLQAAPPPSPGAKSEDGTAMTDLPTVFQIFQNLGLRLQATKGRAEIYVIDHIERPSEN